MNGVRSCASIMRSSFSPTATTRPTWPTPADGRTQAASSRPSPASSVPHPAATGFGCRRPVRGAAWWDSGLVSPQIATNTVVSRDELADFVRPRHHAIVITARADGSPQASPVTCGVDEAGRIVVATYPSRAKTRNARRNPRVSVVVLSDDFGGPWVQIDGDAEVLDVPEAVEALVSYYRAIAGEHPDWAEYRAAMLRQGKSLLRVTPRRWGPVATGGFPPELA